jgi:hypothetical protein
MGAVGRQGRYPVRQADLGAVALDQARQAVLPGPAALAAGDAEDIEPADQIGKTDGTRPWSPPGKLLRLLAFRHVDTLALAMSARVPTPKKPRSWLAYRIGGAKGRQLGIVEAPTLEAAIAAAADEYHVPASRILVQPISHA